MSFCGKASLIWSEQGIGADDKPQLLSAPYGGKLEKDDCGKGWDHSSVRHLSRAGKVGPSRTRHETVLMSTSVPTQEQPSGLFCKDLKGFCVQCDRR